MAGQFLQGSNGTFLVNVRTTSHELRAVYKPSAGERPLWDFPPRTLFKREVATYVFSEALKWGLVPPTVHRKKGPMGPGSLQAFITHDPQTHYFTLSDAHIALRRKILLFDYMLNNADRKAGHFIEDPDGHVWLIDHGLTFHVVEKLRTVAWDHAGEEIPHDLLADIERVNIDLTTQIGVYDQVISLLSPAELSALAGRMRSLLIGGLYPIPPSTRRTIPWPPI
ncbi:MAG: SCO1664 family protein [Anaerolineaceae bacterium]|nr:SCO1664 family protein [Anaerolineaceae bacterium]MBN2677428.1 SCO1664 family protein [Anaerolineaceae bacterium]